jgi:hypothetical protein
MSVAFSLSACFEAKYEAISYFIERRLSHCPFATNLSYDLLNTHGDNPTKLATNVRIIEFDSLGEKRCSIADFDAESGVSLNSAFGGIERKFLRLQSGTFVGVQTPIFSTIANHLIYIVPLEDGFSIYTECKLNGKDCPVIESSGEIIATASKLESQKPTYRLVKTP